MLGVAALAYTLIHLFLYVVQQRYDLVVVVLEIIKRFYLTIGFVSLAAMVALGLTSTDSAIRRMGAESWNRLHRLIYPLTVLAIFHAFLQAKINVSEEVVQIGVFVVLMAVRILHRKRWLNAWSLLAVALLAIPLTAALEALWYGLATGVPWRRILDANFMLALAPRPALVVGAIALALPLLAIFRARPSAAGTRRATA